MKKLKHFFLVSILIFTSIYSLESSENWWQIYFSDPGKKGSHLRTNDPEYAFVKTINEAKHFIYGSFYDISSPQISRAMIKAWKRGVDIKLVTERKNFNKATINSLIKEDVPVIADNRNGLMHNKFAIIDNNIVWTGSYNITENGSRKNNNNAIKIFSDELAGIYLNEFNEMFKFNIFSNKKEYIPFSKFQKKNYIKISSTNISVFFSPEDNIEKIILKKLRKANKSIIFMAFSFTSDSIGELIIKKFKEGVKVNGIFENRGSNTKYSEYIKMKIEGIPVKIDKNRYAMHHKVIIIDGEKTITGSYNFSKGANLKNDENILILDNVEIANCYLKEFKKLYK